MNSDNEEEIVETNNNDNNKKGKNDNISYLSKPSINHIINNIDANCEETFIFKHQHISKPSFGG
ncbi:22673_t:CDS:1, partial [Entrophospora sp. SA101]